MCKVFARWRECSKAAVLKQASITECMQHLQKLLAYKDEELRSKDREVLSLQNALQMHLAARQPQALPRKRTGYSTQYDPHAWLSR